jgi:hypothetical protein
MTGGRELQTEVNEDGENCHRKYIAFTQEKFGIGGPHYLKC